MKAITENQLHDFLINSRHSCEKYCLHNSTLSGITITIDLRIKFGLRKGDYFIKQLSFSRVFLQWSWTFSHWSNWFRLLILLTKTSKSLMLEVAKVLKLTLFSLSDPLKVWPPLSPKFSWWPQFFFKILTTGAKGGIIPKSEWVPDVRD